MPDVSAPTLRPLPGGPLPAGRAWLHTHPGALDAAVAAGALVCMIAGACIDPRQRHGPVWDVHAPSTLGLLLSTLTAALLVLRRRLPLTVLAATGALSAVELACETPRAPVAMSAVIALFTVASTTDRATAWRAGLATGTVLTCVAMLSGPWPWYAQENVALLAWTGMAAAAGDAVRSRVAFVNAMRERAERAERTREEEARRRVAEERLRIARELHDVVAHHIALVNVQAGVAAHVMDRRPDQAKEALAHVREAGRTALGELRATVGLLRQSGDPDCPTEPAPGLGRLEELVDGFRQTGLPVDVLRTGRGPELPATVDLAAYRIVQEALTNVRKHAGAGAAAQVGVVRFGGRLEVTVRDSGPAAAAPADPAPTGPVAAPAAPGDHGDHGGDHGDHGGDHGGQDGGRGGGGAGLGRGGGHGLIGMRERAAALGGTCTAGPREGAPGFEVRAVLPVAAIGDGRAAPGLPEGSRGTAGQVLG